MSNLLPIRDVQLRVETTGSGEPLVLVHGSWSDHRVWDAVVPALARDFRVIRYDRRGHGDSTGSAGTRRQHEDDLAALIDHLAVGPVTLVGTSFGGSIALATAARRPELVSSLSVHEPPLVTLAPDDDATVAELTEVARTIGVVIEHVGRGEHERAAERFANMVLGEGGWYALDRERRATMTATAESFATEQQDPDWASLDVAALAALGHPVLLTDSDDSPAWFRAIVATLADATADAHVHTFPGAGHAPHLTRPHLFATTLSRLRAGTPVAA